MYRCINGVLILYLYIIHTHTAVYILQCLNIAEGLKAQLEVYRDEANVKLRKRQKSLTRRIFVIFLTVTTLYIRIQDNSQNIHSEGSSRSKCNCTLVFSFVNKYTYEGIWICLSILTKFIRKPCVL